MSDSLQGDEPNTTTPSLPSSAQKRLREEPGYTFFWFPRRKRQRQNEETFDPSIAQEPHAANSESSTGVTNALPRNHWTNFLWNRTSSATHDRVGEDASSSKATDLSQPPVSRMTATLSSNDQVGAQPNDANLEASRATQGSRPSQREIHASGDWAAQGDIGTNAARARKRTVWLLLIALVLLLVFAGAFRFIWPPLFGGRFTLTKSRVDPQCWRDQASQHERMSLNQPEICQRKSNERQVTFKMVATLTTSAANFQTMVFRTCQQFVHHVIVTPSQALYQQGKASLHTASEVTMSTLRIICSYPFQSVSALFILLVAHIYNFVVSKRFEYY